MTRFAKRLLAAALVGAVLMAIVGVVMDGFGLS